MTILIAAKAGPGLRPRGKEFIFEPGIVIVADTRLSYADGTYRDDGLKVGVVGPYGICGMASNSIDIPSQAFHDFDGFLEGHPNITATDAAMELQHLLRGAHNIVTTRRRMPELQTTVFFGHCDPSTNQVSLYRFDSNDSFLPKIRDGFDAAGSHAYWMSEPFNKIKHEYPTLTLHPFERFPSNKVPVCEGVAPLVMALIDAAIVVAEEAEMVTHHKQAIGGTVQAAMITAEGPKVANPQWNEELKAWQIYEGRLQ